MEKNKMMLVIVGLLVVLIVTTIGGGFLLMKSFKSTEQGKTHEEAKGSEESKPIEQKDIVTIKVGEPITTNLATTSNADVIHMAKLAVGVGVVNTDKKESPEMIKLITENEIVIKDIIIKIVSSKTNDELKKVDSKETLRQELLKNLQEKFNSKLIVNIYIYEWNVV